MTNINLLKTIYTQKTIIKIIVHCVMFVEISSMIFIFCNINNKYINQKYFLQIKKIVILTPYCFNV